MGFFGALIGWDQSMGALNAVMASYLIEKADNLTRKKIAQEVVNIILTVHRYPIDLLLQDINKRSRVVQMNFIALACDNLCIESPFPRCVWSRVEPYREASRIDDNFISAAVDAIQKDDGVSVIWPGNDVRIDFKKMYEEGSIHSGKKYTPESNVWMQKTSSHSKTDESASTPYFPDIPWAKDKFQAKQYRKLIASGYTFAREDNKVVATTPEGKRQVIYSSFYLDDLVDAVEKSQGTKTGGE